MKRLFDLIVTVVSAVIWVPVGLLCAGLIVICDGPPVFYVSERQVGIGKSIRVLKFRTMRREADKIYNRDTEPVVGVRFLNTTHRSPLYTPIGRKLERFGLTELPQLLHVLTGSMSLVGNRPLPASVMQLLRTDFPKADDRFLTPAGVTGVIQVVGRDSVTDADRLAIESEYCYSCLSGYSMAVDLWLLINTVLILGRVRHSMTIDQIRTGLRKFYMPRDRIAPANLRMPGPGAGRNNAAGIGTDDAS